MASHASFLSLASPKNGGRDKPPTRTKKQNFLTTDCTDYTDFLSSEPALGPGQFLEPLNANSPGAVNRRNLG
jgi:hypothetical protein